MKITESKLRQIIREELRTRRLYSELEGHARELANDLTQKVHPKIPNANIDGGMGGMLNWKLEEKPYTNSGKYFTHFEVSLKNVRGPDVEWTMIGKGKTREEALENALASPVLVGRPFSE